MNADNEKRLKQKILDDILAAAAEDYADGLAREPAPGEEEEHVFSPAFEKNMERMLRRRLARERRKRALRTVARAAAAVAVCVGISAAVVLNVDALRIPVMNFFIEVTDKYTSLRVDTDSEAQAPEEYERYMPKYIPEGFVLSEVAQGENGCGFLYVRGEDRFIFDVTIDLQNVAFDTEDAVVTETEINGYHAFVSAKEKKTIIVMFKGKICLGVSGAISQTEAIKIMESVES